jgi:hypothetical protein
MSRCPKPQRCINEAAGSRYLHLSPRLTLHLERLCQKCCVNLCQIHLEAALASTPPRDPLAQIGQGKRSGDSLYNPSIDDPMGVVGTVLEGSWFGVE